VTRLRILSHVGDAETLGIPEDLRDQVEVVRVSKRGPAPEGLTGEVLVSVPGWSENFDELLGRGVRWVHFTSTGVDRVDFERLPAGLVVTNSRGISAVPIAEWVLAMLLTAAKQLPERWIHEPPGNWRADPGLATLRGRRLAIIGLGSIGVAVAERALPFGMDVRALRRSGGPSPVAGVTMAGSLAEVLDGADDVVLTLPLTPATHHLIDASALGQMRPGVHLINVARGELVDQDALRAALDDGTVGLASLDVVDPEPLPAKHWLFTHPRVRLSAHDSWSWPESYGLMFERLSLNLRAYLAGEPLPDRVDADLGY
jgi:phosphoglycerate dehydrogenase-like enzyme